eukprot:GHRQ01015780.1.p2 GENE.GHRQ01015780.1~~GHRQ01015780.1.p2  ORF type:complete len:143 (+),score=56.29 GHRQ01015780.1:551-979(+)
MCRFCGSALQDWKPHMSSGAKVAPYMRVSFNGKTHKVQVQPGEDGAKEFEQQIRRMLTLPDDQEFDVIFHCRAPGTGDKLQLQGLCAFDAAVHCASMTTWHTSANGSHSSKHTANKTHWMRSLLQRLLSRVDLVGGAAPQSA